MYSRVPIKNQAQLVSLIFHANQNYFLGELNFDDLMTIYNNTIEDCSFITRKIKLTLISDLMITFSQFMKTSNIEFEKLNNYIKPFYIEKNFKQIKKILFFYRLNEYRKIKKNKNLSKVAKVDSKNKLIYIIRYIYEQAGIFENIIFPLVSKDWSQDDIIDFKSNNEILFTNEINNQPELEKEIDFKKVIDRDISFYDNEDLHIMLNPEIFK